MSDKCKVDGCIRVSGISYGGACRSCHRRFQRNGSFSYMSNTHGKFSIMASGLEPTFNMMHQRCENPNNKSYSAYGGRGISVCDRWSGRDGAINFLKDMGDRPKGHSIDRIDNDGNYEPGNCRWADKHTQVSNRTNSSKICVGVVRVKNRNLFESSMTVNKIRHRRFFKNVIDAIEYRKELEYEYRTS